MIRVHEKNKKKQFPMFVAGVTFLGLIIFIAWLLIAFTGFIQAKEQLRKDTSTLQENISLQKGLLERVLAASVSFPVKELESQKGLQRVVSTLSTLPDAESLFIDSGAVNGLYQLLQKTERESERFFSLHYLQGDDALDRRIKMQQDTLRGYFTETKKTVTAYNLSVREYNEVINRFPLALLKYFLSYQERIPFPADLQ